MTSPLAPNRIHSLPVRVSYYLPTTSQTFSTLFSNPQQVYVHPSAGAAAASTSKRDAEDEAWGSIYLKTVVMGVLMASPELHPSHPRTPDLSLYVLDPRETYLRRSRAGSSPYIGGLQPPMRHHQNSSSPGASSDFTSSPARGSYGAGAMAAPTVQEVWTGKGLVSWALDEPGQGKNLITGRLIRSNDFTRIERERTMNPLEALMASDAAGPSEESSWGIEISVGLRSGVGAPPTMHHQVSNVMTMDGRSEVVRRQSMSSSIDEHSRRIKSESSPGPEISHFQRPSLPLPKRHEQPRRPQLPQQPSSSSSVSAVLPTHATPHHPANASRVGSGSKYKPGRPSKVETAKTQNDSSSAGSRRRKNHAAAPPTTRHQLSTIDANADQLKRRTGPTVPTMGHTHLKRSSTAPQPSSDAAESFPTDIPAGLYAKPESLTREQAQRLLASPAFLSMLEKLTGAPIDVVAAAKRAREGDDEDTSSTSNKRPKQAQSNSHTRKGSVDSSAGEANGSGNGSGTHNGFVCWNCGRSKSAVWRTKVMEDGKSVRVCNACGLYWNKMGSMRPPTLWGDVDDDPKDRPRKDKKGTAPRQQTTPAATPVPASEPDIPAHRMDKSTATAPRSSEGFKRTLSSVVEQDAKRIAALRHKPSLPKSNLHQSNKPVAMSSPPRGSTSATKSLRNTSAKWGDVATSSPGGWAGAQTTSNRHTEKSDNFHTDPIQTSPATAMRKSHSHGPYANAVPISDAPRQTLDMPLSDDDNSQSKPAPQVDWGTDLSAFFDVDGFSMPHNVSAPTAEPSLDQRTHGISPPSEPTDFHRALSSGARKRREGRSSSSATTARIATDPSLTEEDDVLSQLFNRTSSVGVSSSPMPFDFSALPPSSPPVSSLGSDLPHSALLLSSPDNSPVGVGVSPIDSKFTPGKSRLRHSVSASAIDDKRQYHHAFANTNGTASGNMSTGEMGHASGGLDFEDIQRMLSNIGAHGNGNHLSPNASSNSRMTSQGNTPNMESTTGTGAGAKSEYDLLHELFGKMTDGAGAGAQAGQDAGASSTAQAESLVGGEYGVQGHGHGVQGGDDIFAMLEGGAFA